MNKNTGKKLKNNIGITLIALVITIIVLLILAGVSISMILNQDGIFSRTEQATNKYRQAKARETLELELSDARIQKYDGGLTDEQLTEKINKIGEELPKEKPDHPELQKVIVDGYIFEIDRNVPKIVDYIGPADGIIITAIVNWINGETQSITVSGVIKTYSGGNIKNVTATKGGTAIAGFPTNGGEYKIENITENTEIVITATDTKGKKATKKIPVLFDDKAPEITNARAVANGMKIKITATATDDISGINKIEYTVEPTTIDKITGTLTSGQEIELTANELTEYTITFIATDKAGNVSEPKTVKATTEDLIPPVLSNAKAEANGMKIKISVTATDTYSEIKQINYSVSPATLDKPTGTLTSGQEIELTANEVREYTVTFTATDNKNNTSEPISKAATTTDKTPPVLGKISTSVTGMLIKINATATDNVTVVPKIQYTISPSTVENPTGTFNAGEEIEIMAKAVDTYTITFTAVDEVGNKSDTKSVDVSGLNNKLENVTAVYNGKSGTEYYWTILVEGKILEGAQYSYEFHAITGMQKAPRFEGNVVYHIGDFGLPWVIVTAPDGRKGEVKLNK